MGRCNSEESRYIFEWVYFWTYNKLFSYYFLIIRNSIPILCYNFQLYISTKSYLVGFKGSFIIETQKTNDKSSSQSV
jgi:hypothetical protein